MEGAHLQCVNNHHVKYEYKSMNTVGVTDYTNLVPLKCCGRTDGRADGRTDGRSGPITRPAFAKATQVKNRRADTILVLITSLRSKGSVWCLPICANSAESLLVTNF